MGQVYWGRGGGFFRGVWLKIGVLVGKWGFGGFMDENGGFHGKMRF